MRCSRLAFMRAAGTVQTLASMSISAQRAVEMSGVSISTIKRLEAEGGDLGGRPATGEKIVTALEKAGVAFTNSDQPGVWLIQKKAKGKRK